MRMKKLNNTRFSRKIDHIFWFLILMLPVASWLSYLFSFNGYGDAASPVISFGSWITNQFTGSNISNNIVYTTLNGIFGSSGAFPVFGPSFLYFVTYLVNVELIHVFFDVIVFVPRLAHKWISKAVQDD